MYWLLLGGLSTTIFLAYQYYQNSRTNIPGPTPLPFLGSIFWFKGGLLKGLESLDAYGEQHNLPAVKFSVGPKIFILLRDLQLNHYTAVKNISNYEKLPILRDPLKPWLGNGLVFSEGEIWKHDRKTINPIFSTTNLSKMIPCVVSYAKDSAKEWEQECQSTTYVDITAKFTQLAMNVILATVVDCDLDDKTRTVFSDSIEKFLVEVTRKVSSPVPSWMWKFINPTNEKKFEELTKYVEGVLLKAIANKGENNPEFKTLLQMILVSKDDEGNGFTETEILDHVKTFIIAGHETTSNALTYLISIVAKNPEVEEKMYQEIITQIPDEDNVTYADLQKLTYMSLAIAESQRLFPVSIASGRQPLEDDSWEGWKLPKQTPLVVCNKVLSYNARVFENPDQFIPERALSAEAKLFSPFNVGPRNCIGKSFAQMEMKAILSTIMRRYKFKLHPNSNPRAGEGYTLKPVDVMVSIEKRI